MIIRPDYYENFKCIADKCKHNCCIGWEIDIDKQTYQKYEKVSGEFKEKFSNHVSEIPVPHFILSKDERCPFLNDDNLCEIILNFDESMLCQICTDHPRFINYFDSRTELGLGLCCEEAARIILSKETKTILISDGKTPDDSFYNLRNNIFEILSNREKSVNERVEDMLHSFAIPSPAEYKRDWNSFFNALEELDSSRKKHWDKINIIYPTENFLEKAYEQLVTYLVYRHLAEAVYDGRFFERISFVALSFYAIKSMNVSKTFEELLDIARIYSSEIEYSDENIEIILDYLGKENEI